MTDMTGFEPAAEWWKSSDIANNINKLHPGTISAQSISLAARKEFAHTDGASHWVKKCGKTWYVKPSWPVLDKWRDKARAAKATADRKAAEEEAAEQRAERYIEMEEELAETRRELTEAQHELAEVRADLAAARRELQEVRGRWGSALAAKRMAELKLTQAENTNWSTYDQWTEARKANPKLSKASFARQLGIPVSTLKSRIKKVEGILATQDGRPATPDDDIW